MQEILAADSLVHSMLVELLLPRLCVYYRLEDHVPPLALNRCAAFQVTPCTTNLVRHQNWSSKSACTVPDRRHKQPIMLGVVSLKLLYLHRSIKHGTTCAVSHCIP